MSDSKEMRRRRLFNFIRPGVRFVARVCFGASTRVYRQIKGPYLVLGNHSYIVDAMLMGAAFTDPVHFVAASATVQGTKAGRLIASLADPIPTDKTGMDLKCIRRMLQTAKAGESIGLYPEGNITIDGSPLPIDKSIAKLCKQLGLNVVLYRTEGGYFKRPKWAYHARKGRVKAEVVDVIEAEEVAKSDVDALYQRIVGALGVDAYELQRERPVPCSGRHKAEGIERLVYLCPCCNEVGHFTSKGNAFVCGQCHHVFRLDDYDMIQGAPFATTTDWNRWQHERFAAMSDMSLAVEGTLYDCTAVKEPMAHGVLRIEQEGLRIEDRLLAFASMRVVLHDANQLLLSCDKQQYRFVPDDVGANVLPLLARIKALAGRNTAG